MIGTTQIQTFFRLYAQALERSQADLDRLDAASGDGDHGATMVMAMREVVETMRPDQDPATALRVAAESFAGAGGSIGPLWGTALLRASRVAAGHVVLTPELLAEMLCGAVDGIRDRGGAEVGDKTLLDAMAPAVNAFEQALTEGVSGSTALKRAADAARGGVDATRRLEARRGRARRARERGIGMPDPGAESACLGWETAARLA